MNSVFKHAQDAAGRLNVKSALNPFLWLCGIGCSLLLAGAWLFDRSESLQHFCALLVYTAILIMITTLVVGVTFAIWRPEKLQSEEYQIRNQALLMIQQMGQTPQLIDPSNVVAISNPFVGQLGQPGASK